MAEPAPATVTSEPPGQAAAAAATLVRGKREASARPLGGVLYTFTWTKLGQLFPVYGGRNCAGKGAMTREGRPTEVLMPEDPTLWDTHFAILYEPDSGRCRIADETGTGGTFLNGVRIDSQGADLPDGAQIRAGNTLFIFRKVLPPTPDTERAPTQE